MEQKKATFLVFYNVIFIFFFIFFFGTSFPLYAGEHLEGIRKKGFVTCGVTDGVPGFSAPNSKREWEGMDVEICRAVAVSLFGDSQKMKIVPLTAQQRFVALQSGEVDLISNTTTMTLSRDSGLSLDFMPVIYYDGQGFLVKKELGIKSIKDLNGGSICLQQGTTTEMNLSDYFRANNLTFSPVVFEKNDEVTQAFIKGRCDALTSDASSLAAERTKIADFQNYEILPELISKEPLAPAVKQGDQEFSDIVRWSVYALITAEELGINSKNIASFANSSNPEISRFLGKTPGNGKSLGVSEEWAKKIVEQVGNYGEIFERHIGVSTPLGLQRGVNALWKAPPSSSGVSNNVATGLMYAPPMR